MAFSYTPYASGTVPFSIGLALLDQARWIEPDERLADELAIKDRLLVGARDVAVRAEADTVAGQVEVRDALVTFLLDGRPDLYRRHGGNIEIVPAGRLIPLDEDLPLVAAARLIQDDLCLMRRGTDGWRLVAAVLTAPSAWSLGEKFGQPMAEIHAVVPGFATHMATKLDRIFDHLQPDKPVWRMNWSLYDDDVLYHPETKHRARRWSGDGGSFGTQAFIRVERQSLRKMPISGDILFTIRVYVDPVAAFGSNPDGACLARGLASKLAGLDGAQLKYKNLIADRDRINAALAALSKPADLS